MSIERSLAPVFSQRPRIELQPTLADIMLETATAAVLLFSMFLLFLVAAGLHDDVVRYLDWGYIDADVASIWGVIIIGLLSIIHYVGLTLIQRIPHYHNYPFEITHENAPRIYSQSVSLVRYIKAPIVLMFTGIQLHLSGWSVISEAEMGIWTGMCIVLILVMVPVVLVRMYRKR